MDDFIMFLHIFEPDTEKATKYCERYIELARNLSELSEREEKLKKAARDFKHKVKEIMQ